MMTMKKQLRMLKLIDNEKMVGKDEQGIEKPFYTSQKVSRQRLSDINAMVSVWACSGHRSV